MCTNTMTCCPDGLRPSLLPHGHGAPPPPSPHIIESLRMRGEETFFFLILEGQCGVQNSELRTSDLSQVNLKYIMFNRQLIARYVAA